MLDKIRLHLRRELHEDYRRGGVAAQPWRDDAVGLGKVLEERDGGRRVIGGAVEEEERARVDRAADERMNLAERQRERGAGQPLMRCVHKSERKGALSLETEARSRKGRCK